MIHKFKYLLTTLKKFIKISVDLLLHCDRYVLDGTREMKVSIARMTTIPMPHRGPLPILRTCQKDTTLPEPCKLAKSKFATMNAMDLLKWGLSYKRNVKKGWLKDLLVSEEILDGTKAATNKRFWEDYKAQGVFMQGMQACFGEDFDPRASKPARDEKGEWQCNKNSVPQNFITVKYILHAYDLSYSTFKRMKNSDAFVPEVKVHKSKGKSVIDDKVFAADFYSPFRMYSLLKFAQWQDTEEGRNADKERKKVWSLAQNLI